MGETGSTSGFMSAIAWPLTIETERLILRSHQPSDFDAWRADLAGRLPQQSPYDEGPVDLARCDADWFVGLCERHHAQASRDDAYIFGVFSQLTHQQLGPSWSTAAIISIGGKGLAKKQCAPPS